MADCAAHLIRVALVHLVVGRIRTVAMRGHVVDLRQQRQLEHGLDLLARGLREVVDVPHDHLVAGAVVGDLRGPVPLRVERGVAALLRLEVLGGSMRHVPRVAGRCVHGLQLRRAGVEEHALHLVELRQGEVAASTGAQALLSEQHTIQLLHGVLEVLALHEGARLRPLRPAQIRGRGLGVGQEVRAAVEGRVEDMSVLHLVAEEGLDLLLAHGDAEAAAEARRIKVAGLGHARANLEVLVPDRVQAWRALLRVRVGVAARDAHREAFRDGAQAEGVPILESNRLVGSRVV
mmetsp:Transcript_1122/g.2770  ORF Transcript_1122/g.2770 Transcript_1122/m.2770 type:complete len:291 (+) Transcript_1122:180-1052(+)